MVVYRFGDNWYLLNGRIFRTLADMVSVCFESTCLYMSDCDNISADIYRFGCLLTRPDN